MYRSRSVFKISDLVVSVTCILICSLQYISSNPSLTDLITDIDVDDTPVTIRPEEPKKTCNRHTPTTSEEFIMKVTPCKSTAALKCEIGGAESCLRDSQAFKTISKIDSSMLQCMLEANTDYLKRIRFIIRSKLLKNSDGSRSMSVDETETQRGMCTLGYTCIEDLKTPELKYLKDVKVDCYSFQYNENERFINGTNQEFHTRWVAPQNYSGPIDFGVIVTASFTEFRVNVSTALLTVAKPSSGYSPTRSKSSKPSQTSNSTVHT